MLSWGFFFIFTGDSLSYPVLVSGLQMEGVVTDKRKPKDMDLDELIEYRKGYQMTEEEMENQDLAIAAAEARHHGDEDATTKTVKAAMVAFQDEGA